MLRARTLALLGLGWSLMGCAAEAPAPALQGEGTAATGATEPGSPAATEPCLVLVARGTTETLGFLTPESGAVRLGPTLDARLLAGATSMGVVGDQLLVCAGTVVRVSIADGHATPTRAECDAVAADARGVWVASLGKLTRYADLAALESQTPSQVVASPRASVLTTTARGLLASEPATNAVVRVSTVDGAQESVALDGFEGQILGLAETAHGQILALPWYTQGRLVAFDGQTGKRLLSVPSTGTNELLHGLACPR